MWHYLINKADGVILLISDAPIGNPYGNTAFVTTHHERVHPATHFYDLEAGCIAEKTQKMIVLDRERAKKRAQGLEDRVLRAVDLFKAMDPELQEFFILLLELPESKLEPALRKARRG